MKKFFILTIALILCVSLLTGCTGSAASPDFIPYWGQLLEEGKDYLEYSEFKISVKEPDETEEEKKDEAKYKLDSSSNGVYTTTLTRESGDSSGSTYKLKNTFKFNGTYNGHIFFDNYESEVTFKVTSDGFTTLTSTKDVKNYTNFNKDGTINSVSFNITNTYNKKKVTSLIDITSDPDNILKKLKSTYKGNLGVYYFDDESLFFGIRTLTPSDSFSLSSYSLLDPIEQQVSKMQAVFVTQEDDKNKVTLAAIDDNAPTINGNSTTQTVECFMIRTVITGTTNIGTPMDLYYAKNTAEYTAKYKVKNKNSDFENTVEVPYYFLVKVEHGDMVYTLNSFDNQAKKA